MEHKKTAEASLERERRTGFLLGLVVALSAVLVGLQWTSADGDYDVDANLLDEIAEELMLSRADREDEAMVAAEEVLRPAVAEEVKVVEVLPEKPLETAEPLVNEASAVLDDVLPGDELQRQEEVPAAQTADSEVLNVRVVEQLPEFPGGMSEFIQWLTRNLKYPEQARSKKIEGRVVVAFIVNKDGSISGEKVVVSAAPLLDREAMRVVRLMPKWKPGVQDGQPCRTMFAVPIVFAL